MAGPVLLDSERPVFPDPESTLGTPDGLLAIGGNLSTDTLLSAYSCGIFPWYESGQPILWWSPGTRAVIYPNKLVVSRSLRKVLRQTAWQITTNQAFHAVIRACAAPRAYSDGTWITEQMIKSYCKLNHEGHAHSIEVWLNQELVGGLYGVAVGGVFCGESMFSTVSNASKVAMIYLDKLCQTRV